MDMNEPMLISEAAEDPSDPERQALAKKIMNGEMDLQWCSPFEGMDIPWTEEEKDRLRLALDKMFCQK